MLLLHVIVERKGTRVRGTAYLAHVRHLVGGALVHLHVQPDRVQRGERPIALAARKRLRVAVLVAGQLNGRLEGLRAERARVRTGVRVRHQVVIVDGAGLVAGKQLNN